MRPKYWYIKERYTSTVSKPHFYAMGNVTVEKAKRAVNPIHGYNLIHRFDTEKEYMDKCNKLGITQP